MWRVHLMTAFLLVLKYVGGFTIPLWLALLPSYIFPTAVIVVFVLGFLTGRIVMMSPKDTPEKKDRE